MEVNARLVIHVFCCVQVKLVERNVTVVLVADVKHSPSHGVVVNLLGRSAVLEDKRDCVFIGQGSGGLRRPSVGKVRRGGGGLLRIGWRIVISGSVVWGSAAIVWSGLRIVVSRCVRVSQITWV